MNRKIFIFTGLLFTVSVLIGCKPEKNTSNEARINSDSLISVFDSAFKKGVLDVWYPLVIDTVDGGYFSNLTFDFQIAPQQPKMLVTQSRHIWTSSQAALFYNDTSFTKYAKHGFNFLKNKMWDKTYGGFFNLRSKEGGYLDQSYKNEKRAYGNTFAIYGLTSLYSITKDTAVLNLAKKTFLWLEQHSYDKKNGGYIDIMAQDGSWISNGDISHNTDHRVAPYKDYNSSIHLLEAFTELYKVWPDSLVKARLNEMLILVRDTFAGDKGYLTLYFTKDWKPVSLRDSSEETIFKNSFIDHVSFGHDVETAFLLLEASHALGIEKDTLTLRIAKKLVDHSLATGYDKKHGGFFYEGYYFKDRDSITIINTEKSWWVQAEGLNALLMMSKIFPSETAYLKAFHHQWHHIDQFILDKEHGEWYISGLDYNREAQKAPKASIWKGNYHNGRALMNCIRMLRNENEVVKHFAHL